MKIERFFCVNLPERTDRWEAISKEFKRLNIDVTRVDGKRIKTPRYAGLEKTNRDIILANKNAESICIFEDDAYFSIDGSLHEYLKKIDIDSQLPKDWGVLYLGCHLWSKRKTLQIAENLLLLNPFEQNSQGFGGRSFAGGSHAIVYNRNAIEWMCSISDDEYYAYRYQDVLVHKLLYKNFKMFCIYPMIAHQIEDFSDLEGQNAKREYIKDHNESMIMKRIPGKQIDYKLSDFPAYCINVDDRVERWIRTKDELQKLDIAVERFSATTPATRKLPVQHDANKYRIFEQCNKESFRRLFAKLLEDGAFPAIVVEDDVKILSHKNMKSIIEKQISYVMANHRNWGAIFLGAYLRQAVSKVNDNLIYLNGYFGGMQCMVVSERLARAFVDSTNFLDSSDNLIFNEIIGRYPCFLINPPSFSQYHDEGSMHDITQKILDDLDEKTLSFIYPQPLNINKKQEKK